MRRFDWREFIHRGYTVTKARHSIPGFIYVIRKPGTRIRLTAKLSEQAARRWINKREKKGNPDV